MSFVRTIARDRRDRLGEGPYWSARDGALYWVDILGQRLNRLRLADDRVDGWDMPDVIGWAIEREGGGWVAGVGRSVVRLDLDPFAVTPLAALAAPDDLRVNDAKADPAGRIWFGVMPFDCTRAVGGFYRLDPDGRVTQLEGGYTIPNGPAISPDGQWLLHTDTALGTIFRYAVHDDGSLGPRAPFIRFEPGWGNPDGMCFDADGGLWAACWGASCVTRFTPAGARERSIALPASQITSCSFAGEALDRMFLTSAADGVDEAEGGALFEVDPGCRGLPPGRYAG